MNWKSMLGGAVAAMTFAGAAQAQLVANGGFETGDFTGWTQFGNSAEAFVSSNQSTWKHSGGHCAAFGSSGSTGGIFQSLAASPGDKVCISFWLINLGGQTNSFDASLDGISIASSSNAAPFGYTFYTGSVTVANASPLLRFTFRHDVYYFAIDDISAEICQTTGACCRGATCVMTTGADCSAQANQRFGGIGSICGAVGSTTPCCNADFNHSGGPPSVQDLFDFLAAYFSGDPSTDINNSGAVTVQDIFDFLAAYFRGCPSDQDRINQVAALYVAGSLPQRSAIATEFCSGSPSPQGIGAITVNQMAAALNQVPGFVDAVAADIDSATPLWQNCAGSLIAGGAFSLTSPCDAYIVGSRSMGPTIYGALPIITDRSTMHTKALCGKGFVPNSPALESSAFTMTLTQAGPAVVLPTSATHDFTDVPATFITNGVGGTVGSTYISPSQANTHYAATSLFAASLELRNGLFSPTNLAAAQVGQTQINNVVAGHRSEFPPMVLNIQQIASGTTLPSPFYELPTIHYAYPAQGTSTSFNKNPLIDFQFAMAELGSLYAAMLAPLPPGQDFPLDNDFVGDYSYNLSSLLPGDVYDTWIGFPATGATDNPNNFSRSLGVPQSGGLALEAYRSANGILCATGSVPSNVIYSPGLEQCDTGWFVNGRWFALINADGTIPNSRTDDEWPPLLNSGIVVGGTRGTNARGSMFQSILYSVGLGVGFVRADQLGFKFLSLVTAPSFNYKEYASKMLQAAQALGFSPLEYSYLREQLLIRGFPVVNGQTALQTIAAEFPPTSVTYSGGASAQSVHPFPMCSALTFTLTGTGTFVRQTRSFTNAEFPGITSPTNSHVAIHLSPIAGHAEGPTFSIEARTDLGTGTNSVSGSPVFSTPQGTQFSNLTLFVPVGQAGQVVKTSYIGRCMSGPEYATWWQLYGTTFGWIIDSIQLNGLAIKADVLSQTVNPSWVTFQMGVMDPRCDAADCSYTWTIQTGDGASKTINAKSFQITLPKYDVLQINVSRTHPTDGVKTTSYKATVYDLATKQSYYGVVGGASLPAATKWDPMNNPVTPPKFALKYLSYETLPGGGFAPRSP